MPTRILISHVYRHSTDSTAMRIVSEKTVRSLLSSLDRPQIKSYQSLLLSALKRYNKDPTLIPQRIVVNRDELDCTHIFMPTFCEKVGLKTLGGSSEGFKGAVLILDEKNGVLKGVLNAMTVTAFRTALASSIPLVKFFDISVSNQKITAYGNGLQAVWHIRLTLLLFPENISAVQIVVRSLNEKSKAMFNELKEEFQNVQFTITDGNPEDVDLKSSTVIYGCVPSIEPAIQFKNLSTEHKTFISIIGSYKPHMSEVDGDIVREAVKNGKVIVDSYEHTLHEAGELIKAGVEVEDCVEIAEIDTVSSSVIDGDKKIVLSKIVGLAIMDIATGTKILEVCEEKDLGVVAEF